MLDISPKITRIGWIGTGVMGRSMCQHIMNKGFSMTVYSRSREKAVSLVESGARWAASPEEVAKSSDMMFTIVGFPKDVREVYFGENGIFKGIRQGSIVADMTTTKPELAREIYAFAKNLGVSAIDAPVSGGDVGARNASLSIMAGGDKDAVDAVMPLFEAMGRKIVYQGGAGSGQHCKMCNQIVIAGTMIGVCESLIYAHKAGLNIEVMLSSIATGAAACWSLDNLAPRMMRREFDTGFFVEHFIKDLGIALDEAENMNLCLPGTALAKQLYLSVKAHGGARLGTQSLMLALENMNRIMERH